MSKTDDKTMSGNGKKAPASDKKTPLSAGQREYEARRAAKAGMSLEKWLASKERAAEADAKAKAKAAEPPKPSKPPGLIKRIIDRAHQPLKPKDAPAGAKPAARPTVRTTAAPRRRSP